MAGLRCVAVAAVLLCLCLNATARGRKTDAQRRQESLKLRDDYISRVQQQTAMPQVTENGSLWSPNGALVDMAADYKARQLNDTVMIVVSASTSAKSSGDLTQNRSFAAESAITGLAGQLSTAGVNPIVKASSAQALSGKGSANSASSLNTILAGQVIAVLPNGNLVLEAERKIVMNNQRETMVVRGVIRPGDVSYANTVASTALMNLEVELKGKGVVSDATRGPNPLVRALLWVVGF